MMKQSDLTVSGRNVFPVIEAMLQEGKNVKFTVSGNSMWPLIAHNRDSVLLSPCDNVKLKKGEIILFRSSIGHYVLHRISSVKKSGYITTGDGNLHRDAFVPMSNVIAKVTAVYRKGKTINCEKWTWKLTFRIWMALFPIRRHLFRLWHYIRKHIK